MSTISASTTTTTAYKVTADTTGTLVLQTGSTPTTAVTIDANQNMGLGVTPSAWSANRLALQIGGSSGGYVTANNGLAVASNYYYSSGDKFVANGYAPLYYMSSGNGQHQWFTSNNNSSGAGAAVSLTQAMTLDASGNLGVGTTSPQSYSNYKILHVAGPATNGSGLLYFTNSNNSLVGIANADGANSLITFGSQTNHPIRFATNDTERARIDTSGNLLVGTTDSGITTGAGVKIASNIGASTVSSLSTNSNSCLHMYSTGAGAYRFYVGWGGTVYATSTTISAISDIRFKENVRDLDAGLAEVMALKPRLYDWKEGKGADIKNARGFIAQEFEEVFPDLIDEWKDPAPEGEEPYKSVRQDLIPVLVKAIQEQQAIIETLTSRITALENK